jgi:prevent-host-death family protein
MQVTATEARKRWKKILDRAERGERVTVTRGGRVAAVFARIESESARLESERVRPMRSGA